jgi:hypothetical protein
MGILSDVELARAQAGGFYVCVRCVTTMRREGRWCELHGPIDGLCLGCRRERIEDMEAAYQTGFDAGQRVRFERPECMSWEVAYADNMRTLRKHLSMAEETTAAYRDGFKAGWLTGEATARAALGAGLPNPRKAEG